MTFSDKEMKGLGRSTEINIHNSRSLTCVHLKYVSNILQLEETLTVEELAHAHTHTHTHTQTHTHTHTSQHPINKDKRELSFCAKKQCKFFIIFLV